MKKINEMDIDELYHEKGKVITNMQILQTRLQNINIQISELLRNQGGDNASTNGNGNKR